ncbi:MAG: hypothetical protein LDL11_06245 [Desulfarculus sp.]|nr:hypothetical protein [Desulfarculus sp.]
MTRPVPPPPLPVVPGLSNYARRAWWRGFELTPGVSLKTSVRLRPSLADRAQNPRDLLLAVAGAASAALTLHPRLNYYTFWGRLVWAGWPVRVGLVIENPDLSCDMAVVADAHQKSWPELAAALRQDRQPAPVGAYRRLREAWPTACYLAERLSGFFERSYIAEFAPLFISMIAIPGIEEAAFAPAHSMALFPGWPQDGRLPLTLCFNHQLANARPLARYLLTIRDLLA